MAFATPFGQVTVSNGTGYKEFKEKEKRNKVSLSTEIGLKLLLLYGTSPILTVAS